MLRIHHNAMTLIRLVAPIVTAISQHDSDLASQLRRALSSVPLNIAEGSGQIGGRRRSHYSIALGSALEARSALETAMAWGYLAEMPDNVGEQLRIVIGSLHKCVKAAAPR